MGRQENPGVVAPFSTRSHPSILAEIPSFADGFSVSFHLCTLGRVVSLVRQTAHYRGHCAGDRNYAIMTVLQSRSYRPRDVGTAPRGGNQQTATPPEHRETRDNVDYPKHRRKEDSQYLHPPRLNDFAEAAVHRRQQHVNPMDCDAFADDFESRKRYWQEKGNCVDKVI